LVNKLGYFVANGAEVLKALRRKAFLGFGEQNDG